MPDPRAPVQRDVPTGLPSPFTTTETHLSWLVLVGDLVLKAKKPLRTEFLDLTTVAAREAVVADEVRLNRRLAPDVYLGVAHLSGAGLQEPVVVMRRMPEDRRLATLVAHGEPLEAEVTRLADVVQRFHRTAPRVPEAGEPAAVVRLWRDNAAQLRRHSPPQDLPQLSRLDGLAERYLAGRTALLRHRQACGRSVDGHGDLLADDVFLLADGPRVLDCLEFDDRLRAGDVLADVCFLAMDLERLGRPDLGRLLLQEHRRRSGDDWPDSLADYWTAYRALVRAKVAVLRAEQGDRAAPAARQRLVDLAEQHLRRAQPRLVLVGGGPGTGKSSLAAALAARTDWPVLRSDVVRKQLVGRALDRHEHEGPYAGAYRPEVSARVLAELLRRAGELLGSGRSVVLDATWARSSWRAAACDLAARCRADLLQVRAVAPDAVADERLRQRAAQGTDPSEATVEVARRVRESFAPWPDAVPVDTTASPAAEVEHVLDALAAGGWTP